MIRRAMLTITISLLLAPAVSSAATVTDRWGHPGPQPWQLWIDTSLIPIPAWPVTLHFATCPNTTIPAYACDDGDDIYIDPASPPSERRRLLYHELGHWFDAHGLSDHDRDIFRALASAAPGPWLNGQEGRPSAGEQFAEAFSLCAMYRRWRPEAHTFWLIYWHPGPRRHGRVCAFMRTVAARYTTA